MEAPYLTRHPFVKDIIGIAIFIAVVIVGVILINTFIFRSYHVVGPSMESTLYTGDRLIVDRLPETWGQLTGKPYVPERGAVIVFKNPQFAQGVDDEYVVKRVIGLPGEHVVLKDGVYTVFNKDNPKGFDPDQYNHGEPGSPTSGSVDVIVPDGQLFVSGDHREGTWSYDSRYGMGTIPLYDVVGPVSFRIFPFNKVRSF